MYVLFSFVWSIIPPVPTSYFNACRGFIVSQAFIEASFSFSFSSIIFDTAQATWRDHVSEWNERKSPQDRHTCGISTLCLSTNQVNSRLLFFLSTFIPYLICIPDNAYLLVDWWRVGSAVVVLIVLEPFVVLLNVLRSKTSQSLTYTIGNGITGPRFNEGASVFTSTLACVCKQETLFRNFTITTRPQDGIQVQLNVGPSGKCLTSSKIWKYGNMEMLLWRNFLAYTANFDHFC